MDLPLSTMLSAVTMPTSTDMKAEATRKRGFRSRSSSQLGTEEDVGALNYVFPEKLQIMTSALHRSSLFIVLRLGRQITTPPNHMALFAIKHHDTTILAADKSLDYHEFSS